MGVSHALRRILVDLTPLLPGGDNGGAKPLARSLVSELSMLAPQVEFTLLTSSKSYAELADLERPNVHRENVDVDLDVIEPKGVALSHMNLLSNVEQVRSHLALYETDILFNPLPTFHCFGLTVGSP